VAGLSAPAADLISIDMNRRDFVTVLGSALGATVPVLHAAATRRIWGLQLYTVLSLLEVDFEGTLREISAVGYKEVETIGTFGREPAQVADLLAKYGLVSPSQHLAPPDVYGAFSAWTRRRISTGQIREYFIKAFAFDRAESVLEQGIATAKALGQKYVVWQILFEPFLASRQVVERVIRLFNRAGDTCAREGLVFAFHNHDREFVRLEGDIVYDLMLANTDSERVKMELDFHRMRRAHADPFAYLAKYAGRYRMCHVKDMKTNGDYAVVGNGVMDIPGLLNAASAAGVTQFYVELDRPSDPMREIRQSYAYLQKKC
jgi:sugar phosphate isomerase/epimerase